MRNWASLISDILKAVRPVDPTVRAEYQRPFSDGEAGSADLFVDDANVDLERVGDVLRPVLDKWGGELDSDTNSGKASLRINLPGDVHAKFRK